MKKILTILLVIFVFSSCKKLEDYNKNTKDPIAVSGESLFTGAQKNLFDQMVSTNVNYNVFRFFVQYWTETTYVDEVNYDLVTRTIPDNHWDKLYRDVLKDFDESGKIITATSYLIIDPSPAVKKNKLAIVEVMKVFTMSILVETFGDVPYFGALDINNVLPVYDKGIIIYTDLISRLNVAIADMDPTFGSFDDADNMYQGDVASWIKFANSLKLRMGLLLSDVDAALAQTTVEAAAAGVFTSNTDNARIIYLSAQPNSNPVYNDVIASGRRDFVAANTFVDSLNNLNDPRRQFYFTQIDTSSFDTIVKLAYVGGKYGRSNSYRKYSHIGTKLVQPTFEGTILDYSEVEFLLAEAAARGFNVGGTPESHYNAAINASMDYWGVATADADAYLADPRIAYSTAFGTYKQKIGLQKWIALYNRGFEAWTSWRMLDYPLLEAPPSAKSDLPVRYTYPILEQTLNGTNYQNASTAIGGDNVTTKLFWDLQ
ncbi:MAG: SusD/RagB family nutrient-binding outer membrane lipoprotein [Bacteroidetes bacterium]|nr:SusD/RagB family nutrient-binding outer membrane lipoprotein [Bacteroidota bacterium]